MTQSPGERSVSIGGSVSNSAIVTGDLIIQIVTEPVRRLRRDYAVSIENFLRQYLGDAQHRVPFGGRDAALRDLDAWLASPDQPYALLTAPAGRGKSALLVRWLAALRERHPEWPAVFVPVSARYGTNMAGVTFAALVTQLARAFGEAPPGDANTSDDLWRDLFGHYLKRPPPQGRLLMVLDGLDEAANWDVNAGLFPAQPPAGLKVIVSARLTADRPQPDDWRRALGWERPPARCFDLAPLDRAGLRDVLQKMGAPLDALAEQSPIVEELYQLTEGDPLLVSLYVGDLWQRGEGVRRLRAEDLRGLRPSYAGYFEGWWDAQLRLWGEAQPLREPGVRETLNLLSAALAPLRADDLLALADPALGMDSWLLKESLRPLARFVVKAGEGYVFAHPRLGAYFWEEELSEDERRKLEERFLAWGRGVLDDLAAGRVAPRATPPYLVRSYRAHLERAGAPMADLRRLVETHAWAQAWDALEGGFGGYLSDVQAVWRRAVQEDRQVTAGNAPAPWLGLEVRCALIEASIRSLAANLPPELPALLVRHGHWTPRQALVHVRQMPDEWRRAAALTQMLPHLPEELLAEALAVAREITDEEWRAVALGALAARLSEPLRSEALSEALAAARKIKDERRRAKALGALAPHLSEPLLSEALAAAREIKDEEWRAKALGALAPHLSEPLLSEALAAAREVEDGWQRAKALVALAARLGEPLLSEALAAAWEIEDEQWRAKALGALAAHLSELLRSEALSEALAAVREIKNERRRVEALGALAAHLSEPLQSEVLSEALAAAREIRDVSGRAEALSALAAHLSEPLQSEVLSEALATAREIEDERRRAEALGALAAHLGEPLRSEASSAALAAARDIEDADDRAPVLTTSAKRLADLPRAQAYPLWADTLPVLAHRTRKDLLSDLRALAPLIHALGGEQAAGEAFRAVRDVGAWWP
ncbi:MAG: hypothetical protein ACFLMY_09825 [Candidatus Brachytrichaceae bacterium NZ_4S206]|jgi:hypothetical protein